MERKKPRKGQMLTDGSIGLCTFRVKAMQTVSLLMMSNIYHKIVHFVIYVVFSFLIRNM